MPGLRSALKTHSPSPIRLLSGARPYDSSGTIGMACRQSAGKRKRVEFVKIESASNCTLWAEHGKACEVIRTAGCVIQTIASLEIPVSKGKAIPAHR